MEWITAICRSDAAYRLGWALIHTLWLGTALAATFAVAMAVLRRRSANTRYLLSCIALLVLAAVPVAAFVMTPTPGAAGEWVVPGPVAAEPVGEAESLPPAPDAPPNEPPLPG